MATQIGSGTGVLATYLANLADTSNIETALKQLYYGTTGGTLSQTTGIYGALYTLFTGNPTLAGNVTITGSLTINGTTTTINANTLVVDDKNIEIGSVSSGVISTTGTIGTVSGAGPFTATITGMTDVTGLIPGQVITATNGTGSFGAGVMTVASIVSSTSMTVSSTLTFTAGTVTNITGAAASDSSANGGGITLKGTTDKSIIWDSTNSNWTTSEHWNLASGKALRIGAGGSTTNVISGTAATLLVGENATGLTLGASTTGTSTVDISVGATNLATKTINIGTGASSGSHSTVVNIGTSAGSGGIFNHGLVYTIQPSPTTGISTAQTLTIAQLESLIITTAQPAGITLTFPTGTSIEGGLPVSSPNGTSFEFCIINAGTGTILLGANGNTLVGLMSVAASTTGRFRVVKNATNAYTIYRIG